MNKTCCVCELEFPATLEYFHKRHDSLDGFRCDCKVCRKTKNHKTYNNENKRCSKCHIIKPNTSEFFNKSKNISKEKNRSMCKECHNFYMREHHLMKKYNLNNEDYLNKYKKQNGKCSICQLNFDKLVIDHNHNTNKVRDLLCDNCNTGIGLLKEDVYIIENAINYLKKFKNEEFTT